MMPRVSIIIPSFNRARFLPETLRSVLGQSVADLECIVVDDGSSDGTKELVAGFSARDSRVRYLQQVNKGPSAARNFGLEESRGRYIQFLDSDDVIVQDKLEKQLRQLENVNELALSYCDYRYCAHDDVNKSATRDRLPPPRFITERALWDIASRWETGLSIPMHCFLFDARFFRERQIRFDEGLANHEDWDCWMQIFALDPLVFHIDEVLAIYRLHDDSICVDRGKLAIGFEKAIRKQQRIFEHDRAMRKILEAKMNELRSNQHFRDRGMALVRNRLARAYKRSTPWPIQKLVTSLSRRVSSWQKHP